MFRIFGNEGTYETSLYRFDSSCYIHVLETIERRELCGNYTFTLDQSIYRCYLFKQIRHECGKCFFYTKFRSEKQIVSTIIEITSSNRLLSGFAVIWFMLAFIISPFLISYYVLQVPYGLIIQRRKFIEFWRKTEQIFEECKQALRDKPLELEELVCNFVSLSRIQVDYNDSPAKIERIVQILQDRRDILYKLKDFIPSLNRQSLANTVNSSTHINGNSKIILREESEQASRNQETNEILYTSVLNPLQEMTNFTEDLIKVYRISGLDLNSKVEPKCFNHEFTARIMAVIILFLGFLFGPYEHGFLVGYVFTESKISGMFCWLLGHWIFHGCVLSTMVFCYLSSFYTFPCFRIFFQKHRKKSPYTAMVFQPFRSLWPAILLKALLLVIFILLYQIVNLAHKKNMIYCTKESFEKYGLMEFWLITQTCFLPLTIIIDANSVRNCSAFSDIQFKQIIRFLFCWRIHSND